MDAKAILEGIALYAPSVAISIKRTLDDSYVWDGTGPDPVNYGLDPYDVDVVATTIVCGKYISGTASLGGSYYDSDEPIGDIHGYLQQMLLEALRELLDKAKRDNTQWIRLHAEITSAIDFINSACRRASV